MTENRGTRCNHTRGVLAIAEAVGLLLVSPISENETLTIAAAIDEAWLRSGSVYRGALMTMQ